MQGTFAFVDHLESLDCAAYIRFRPRIDRVPHPNIGHHRLWSTRAGGRYAGTGIGTIFAIVSSFAGTQSSRLDIQVKRLVVRMPQTQQNGLP